MRFSNKVRERRQDSVRRKRQSRIGSDRVPNSNDAMKSCWATDQTQTKHRQCLHLQRCVDVTPSRRTIRVSSVAQTPFSDAALGRAFPKRSCSIRVAILCEFGTLIKFRVLHPCAKLNWPTTSHTDGSHTDKTCRIELVLSNVAILAMSSRCVPRSAHDGVLVPYVRASSR